MLGLTEVSPAIKEAAMAAGMTKFQSLFQVELPMAFPVVFTGIRIATVNSISTAVFATFVGGGGIGSVIYRGIRHSEYGHDPLGYCCPDDHGDLLRHPDGLDRTPHDGEERSHPYPLTNPLNSPRKEGLPECPSVSSLFSLPLPCLPASSPAGSSPQYEIELYDGNYSEVQLVHKMVELLVEDRTDIEVTIKDQMSSVLMFRELTRRTPAATSCVPMMARY